MTNCVSFTSHTVEKCPHLNDAMIACDEVERLRKDIRNAPKFSNDTVSTMFESITDFDRKITTSIIICGTLLILARRFVDR